MSVVIPCLPPHSAHLIPNDDEDEDNERPERSIQEPHSHSISSLLLHDDSVVFAFPARGVLGRSYIQFCLPNQVFRVLIRFSHDNFILMKSSEVRKLFRDQDLKTKKNKGPE